MKVDEIPSMGGREIGFRLAGWACHAREGEAIVELGTWLGAGTAQMAMQVAGRDVEIHCYDRFTARGSEIAKAAAQGVTLKAGQNTASLVRRYLAPIGAKVTLHRGNIASARRPSRPIALHVDDACKRPAAFIRALRHFSPGWIPGRTVVVLMDWLYWLHKPDPELKFQYDFVMARPGFIELWRDPGLSSAAFLFEGPLLIDQSDTALYSGIKKRR